MVPLVYGGPARAARPRGYTSHGATPPVGHLWRDRDRRTRRAAREERRLPASSTTRATASSPAGRRCSRVQRSRSTRRAQRCSPGSAAILGADGGVPGQRPPVWTTASTFPWWGSQKLAAAALRSALARGNEVNVSLGAPGRRTNEGSASIAALLLSRPCLRRRGCRARVGGARSQKRHGGARPECQPPRGLRDDQRHERRRPPWRAVLPPQHSDSKRVPKFRRGAALKDVLVGTSTAGAISSSVAAQGAVTLDPLAAAAAEVVAEPATVRFGSADEPGWTACAESCCATSLLAASPSTSPPPPRRSRASRSPPRPPASTGARRQRAVKLTARVAFLPRRVGAIQGRARLEVSGGGRVIVPWAVALPFKGPALMAASDVHPLVPRVRSGACGADRPGGSGAGSRRAAPAAAVSPRCELWRGGERLGLLARLRDVLPGRYAFGLTGRGPRGGALAKGRYRLRVLAVPPDGPAEAETVRFRIR